MLNKPLTFTVPGIPVATARAGRHFNPRSGKTHSFTPPKTRNFQALVRMCFVEKYPEFVPLSGPVQMILEIYMPIPSSMKKAERIRAEADETAVFHVKKPDGKNIRWGVEDALEGIVFINDSQICIYGDRKTYSARPRLEITIAKIEEEGK